MWHTSEAATVRLTMPATSPTEKKKVAHQHRIFSSLGVFVALIVTLKGTLSNFSSSLDISHLSLCFIFNISLGLR